MSKTNIETTKTKFNKNWLKILCQKFSFVGLIKLIYPTLILIFIFVILSFIFLYVYNYYFFPLKYKNNIIEISEKYDVEASLIASIINAESKFDSGSISSMGAVGLMQIMPATANFVIEKQNKTNCKIDLFDVNTNLEIGISYVRYLLNKFEDYYTMLCAYNAGEGKVKQWLKDERYSLDGKALKSTPYAQTNYYASKVLRNHYYYKCKMVY